MKTNSELRQVAKATMKGNWGTGICVCLVGGLLMGLVSTPQIVFGEESPLGNLLYGVAMIFFGYPLLYGINYFAFLRLSRIGELKVENIFGPFNSTYYLKTVCVALLTAIYTFLWTLLLIVPGVIKGLSYFLAPYILIDNPELNAEQAICRSMEMMKGHKMDLFLITLGYVGLGILSVFLLFIPMLWLMPYYQTVYAKFYEEIKATYQSTTHML